MKPTNAQFREWGAQGGKRAALNMTARQRKIRATVAVVAREAKRNGKLKAHAK